LIRRHKQFIALFATLVILLAQFSVLVHATDHPFHQDDAQCITFQSAEQNKYFFQGAPSLLVNDIVISDAETQLSGSVLCAFCSYYSSRAPPATII
jgi:hypothetical protein